MIKYSIQVLNAKKKIQHKEIIAHLKPLYWYQHKELLHTLNAKSLHCSLTFYIPIWSLYSISKFCFSVRETYQKKKAHKKKKANDWLTVFAIVEFSISKLSQIKKNKVSYTGTELW